MKLIHKEFIFQFDTFQTTMQSFFLLPLILMLFAHLTPTCEALQNLRGLKKSKNGWRGWGSSNKKKANEDDAEFSGGGQKTNQELRDENESLKKTNAAQPVPTVVVIQNGNGGGSGGGGFGGGDGQPTQLQPPLDMWEPT